MGPCRDAGAPLSRPEAGIRHPALSAAEPDGRTRDPDAERAMRTSASLREPDPRSAGYRRPDRLLQPTGGLIRRCRDPLIYALGDCSSMMQQRGGSALPPTAQVAHQQADHFVRNIEAILDDSREPPGFPHRDLGSLVSLGNYGAYGSLGKAGLFSGVTIRGRLAQLGHVLLYREHQSRLHGFWKGSLLWFVDVLNARLRPTIRLD